MKMQTTKHSTQWWWVTSAIKQLKICDADDFLHLKQHSE